MIKAVIFDMDGLLIDSEPMWQEAEMETFSRVAVPLTKKRAKETMGLRADEIVEHWYSRYPWKKRTKKEIENRIIERVIELIKEKGVAHRGAKEIVELFVEENIPIAIASSSPTKIIDAVLEKITIRQHIKVIHSAENELYGKPYPAVYITTAKKLNIDPQDCLVFEDSPNGVLAAKAARMKCIAVPGPTVKDNKTFFIADMIINSLEDFRFDYLKKFN